MSTKRVRERILRRDDFYDPEEVRRLLEHAPGVFEEAFWLCGAHAGFRLPGEAQGTRWGAVDFKAGVIRPYDNWVRNAPEDTKTSDSVAVPMTPRLKRALAQLKLRGWATADDDFVFTNERRGRPVCETQMRAAFKLARSATGLKPIRMYNLRHSFGTSLARGGVDLRTIQALMRHDRLTTAEQYLAYAPQPDLAERLARALDPPGLDQVGGRSPAGIELAVAYEQRPAARVKVGLSERERLLDAQPTTPEHRDQGAQPPAVTVIVGLAHHGDDLLDGRRVGRVVHPLVARRTAGVEAGQGRW